MPREAEFERILSSPVPLPDRPRFESLGQLIFAPSGDEQAGAPIILGCFDRRMLTVTLAQLRQAVLGLAEAFESDHLERGDTVCLVRWPRTSEALCAVVYAALSACGLRVLLPMYLEPDRFLDWLRQTQAKAVLWSAAEVMDLEDDQVERAQLARLQALCASLHLPCRCLLRDLHILDLLESRPTPQALPDARIAACSAPALEEECLVLTTSGTSGQAKLVRYRQGAILRGCSAWEAAGLYRPERQGGRGLCLLFAHSMGIRAFWNALWTRRATCLVTPEWFVEHPERVRALLINMRPEHVTGGPAVYRALLELMRLFPELRSSCLRDLRCAVSTGAPFDEGMARRVEDALGLRLENAFGMTEAMQVCSTLLGDGSPHPRPWLGEPLPGVRLGLERCADEPEPSWRLHVSTPYGCIGYVEEDGPAEPVSEAARWLPTGDLVTLTPQGLCFAGREERDFIKDAFGAKIPLGRVAGWYADLGQPVLHLHFAPLREEPGLGALLFLAPASGREAPSEGETPPVADRALLNRVQSLLEARQEQLHATLEGFEFRHFTIVRFACVRGPVPLTGKGTVDAAALAGRFGPLLARLTGPYLRQPFLVLLDREKFGRTRYARLSSPRQGQRMHLARLDKHYLRGQGDRLYYRERGQEVEVVDFVGGYGGNLLGHRHPEVVAAAADFVAGQRVFLSDQGSARLHEGELGRRLSLLVSQRTGVHCVVRLGSTGAEAVEMGLAHALLEREEQWQRLRRDLRRQWGASHPEEVEAIMAHNEELLRTARPKIIALQGAFHGHTGGARAVLFDARKRTPFQSMLGFEAIFIPPDGQVDLDALLAREVLPLGKLVEREGRCEAATEPFSRVIAAIAEPILGEGGVTVVSLDLLRRLADRGFPLILDEIQSGMGRSGEFLASEGVAGAYYLFSKSLGGGVAKVSALLIDRNRYLPRFDELYASTFAGDAWSCAIACRVLDLIERHEVPRRARERGAVLRQALEAVQAEFPEVIGAVRGRGLLLGIELSPAPAATSFILRALIDRELYGIAAASYLLNRYRVRLLPTLSAPNTLRVEPSAWIDDEGIARLRSALTAFCRVVRARAGRVGLLSGRGRAGVLL